ncbi:glucans biosynthesis protein [Methylomagnum ishizawai]|uniref:Glucans biosynthesis protein D n=1 Tax=Methylomagnum ishizawai TaxID=1760988 RepID=A0A1Y6D8X7_9GAMM|nr:glucan biosynthesis protein D [Methylomagnum ishizawai]SMF96674.1 glucans biosynthesis protein [Methylomagnum ishizawai]
MKAPISRRAFLRDTTLLTLAGLVPGPMRNALAAPSAALRLGPALVFSYETLTERAKALAKKPHTPPPRPLPQVVQRIDYEAWGQIRYRTESALFAEGPGLYPATFFHVGQFFQKSVKIHVLENGQAREILYNNDYFVMPKDSIAHKLSDKTGFAGFRLQESRNREDWRTQDWIAFLGASYFRAIGALNQYGLSARGIIVDAAEPKPEEFPDFTEFFIEETDNEGDPVHVYALLDGPSLTGAYHFAIKRTEGVVQDIEAQLFLRKDVGRLGFAPLTSMYWFSETEKRRLEDWRPEVHDSDGLAIWTGGGERLWRPLVNPSYPVTSSFVDKSPKGFGLLQRDRVFEDYLDGVNYERRPSLWVEPLEDWGAGAVQLVELPTDDEIHDNIVAYWRPAEPAKVGNTYRLRYRLHWLADEPYPAAVARCVATRIGRGGQPGKPRPKGVYKFSVEFAGAALDPLWGDTVKAEPVITTSSGTVGGAFMEPIPGTKRWRAIFDLTPQGGEPVELRLYIRGNGDALTETWLYQFRPPAGG